MENNTWKLILKNLDVPIKKCASNDSPLAYPLTSFAILKVTGDDRYLFLQNQFTNDLENEKKIVQLSAWCNPKGKIITNFIIINTGENYLLIFKKNIKDYVYKKLNMYILRSKVKIDDISSSYLLLGLSNITQLKLDQTTVSLDNIVMKNINDSPTLVNEIAPEHLAISVQKPSKLLKKINTGWDMPRENIPFGQSCKDK